MGFPGGSDGKKYACNAEDLGSNLELEKFPGEGNGNPFLYSCQRNPMDRGACQVAIHRISRELDMT